jgi:hypothetical protein
MEGCLVIYFHTDVDGQVVGVVSVRLLEFLTVLSFSVTLTAVNSLSNGVASVTLGYRREVTVAVVWTSSRIHVHHH